MQQTKEQNAAGTPSPAQQARARFATLDERVRREHVALVGQDDGLVRVAERVGGVAARALQGVVRARARHAARCEGIEDLRAEATRLAPLALATREELHRLTINPKQFATRGARHRCLAAASDADDAAADEQRTAQKRYQAACVAERCMRRLDALIEGYVTKGELFAAEIKQEVQARKDRPAAFALAREEGTSKVLASSTETDPGPRDELRELLLGPKYSDLFVPGDLE